jgi:hypothetical protein
MNMGIDPALEEALQIAVGELGQPKSVASRLTAWLRTLSEGETSEDRDLQFYESLLE